jgi:ElaB/YqjD/DUF883 family membrane-anchored ribosome-binding protein
MRTFEAYTHNGASKEHRDSSRIQHDLDEILSEMGETIEAIQTKFSPGEMLDHLLHGLRGFGKGSSDFATNLGRTIRDNPVPTALIGAGVGALMLQGRSSSSSTSSSTSLSSSGTSGMLEGTKERAAGLLESVKDRASSLGDSASHMRDRASDAGHRLADSTRMGVDRTREVVTRTWDEQPLVIGAICVAIGAALGSLLPVSRREEQALGPLADQAKDRLAGAAQDTMEHATAKMESTMERPPGETIEAQTSRRVDPTDLP